MSYFVSGVSQQFQPHQHQFIQMHQQNQAQQQLLLQSQQMSLRKSNINNNDVPITPMGTNLDSRLNLMGLQSPNSLFPNNSFFSTDSKASTSHGESLGLLSIQDISTYYIKISGPSI